MRKVLHLMATQTDDYDDWLSPHRRVRYAPRDATIIQQGRPFEALMVLLEGQLSVRLGERADQAIATLFPGEVLGDISFIDERPPSASVVVVHDSHVLAIDRDVLSAKLDRDSPFAARFYRGLALFLASRLRTTTAHLGYGRSSSAVEEAETVEAGELEGISLAARRFDQMLRRLRAAGGA
jgi:CRP-like cAMP-binding protein